MVSHLFVYQLVLVALVWLCVTCRHYFLETLGTLFYGKRTSVELIVRVIACLAEGLEAIPLGCCLVSSGEKLSP